MVGITSSDIAVSPHVNAGFHEGPNVNKLIRIDKETKNIYSKTSDGNWSKVSDDIVVQISSNNISMFALTENG